MKSILQISTAVLLVTASNALAIEVPSSAESGRIQSKNANIKSNIKLPEQELVKSADASDIAGADKIMLQLDSVEISGNTAFSDDNLQELYKEKIGTKVSLADMYKLRDAITKKYRDAGYVLSRAVVPPQDLKVTGSKFKIRIIEGYVKNVTKQGSSQADQSIVDNYIAKIKQDGPLNTATLERYLLLLNDLPGTKATAAIKPSETETGAADIIINIEHKYTNGFLKLDNSGNSYVGRTILTSQVAANSALGLSEKLTVTAVASSDVNEMKFGNVALDFPIGYEGTKLNFSYGQTATSPGGAIAVNDIEGDTKIAAIEVTHPFLRTRRENLNARVGFAAKSTDTNTLKNDLYNDKIRVATLGATYDLADSWGGNNLIDFSVNQGLDIFGARDAGGANPKSRANADIEFTKLNLEASRLQDLGSNFSFLASAKGQYSFQPLVASEEFGVGGNEDIGRGYDFSEITGDSGFAAKAELQYGLDLAQEYLEGIQLYGFYDFGKTWQRKISVSAEQHSDSLASTGAGARINVDNAASGYIEVAKPLTKKVASENEDGAQVQFGISYIF